MYASIFSGASAVLTAQICFQNCQLLLCIFVSLFYGKLSVLVTVSVHAAWSLCIFELLKSVIIPCLSI